MTELISNTAQLFKLLGDPTRLSIVTLLLEKPLNVTEIGEALKLEQSVVSHQLQKLKAHRLVISERAGRHQIYAPADDHIKTLIEQGIEHAQEVF